MSGFYSIRPRARSIIRKAPAPMVPNPYGEGTADYAERNATHATELPNGLTRVDIGEPPKRVPSETQPVPKGKPKAAVVVRSPALAAPAAPQPAAPTRDRKEHRAITREP